MILLLDIGNTRVKWRFVDGTTQAAGSCLCESFHSRKISELIGLHKLTKIFVSCVGHADLLAMLKLQADRLQYVVESVEVSKTMLGITLAYEDVSRLGVDRPLAMIGAFDGRGVLVIDAGSAITADYISCEGEHLGGYILPGYAMSRELFIDKTASVGVVGRLGCDALGKDTQACVDNGLNLMLKSLLDGLLIKGRELGIESCLVTGGDAELLKGLSVGVVDYRENLVLDGLNKYAQNENQRKGEKG